MIRILFFSDTHLGFDYPRRSGAGHRRRGQDFFENYRHVLQRARSGGADLVIHGGDLFYRARLPNRIIELAYQPLIELAGIGIPVAVVPGNHEFARLSDPAVLEHSGIDVFHRPRTIQYCLPEVRINLSGIPFVRNDAAGKIPAVVKRLIDRRDEAGINLLAMHQAVEGAQVGRHNYNFRPGADVVSRSVFDLGFQAGMVGHIHRRQILKTASGIPVIFSGSTERTSLAEQHETKGFCWLNFVQQAGHWQLQSIDFEDLPTREMVELKPPEILSLTEFQNWLNAELPSIPTDSIVHLRVPEKIHSGAERLTSSQLRDLFPRTMSVNLRCGQFRPRRSRTGLRLFDYDPDNRQYQPGSTATDENR